jgi:uncharacterized FlgJ-related protein
MLYTYCKESLSFKKVTPTRKLGGIVLLIGVIGYTVLTSMVSNAHQEGFKEALSEPIETELVVLDSPENTFSRDGLVEEIKKLNIRFPHIVLAQSILETGYWESRIYQENHNLFGMKQARARATTANGTQLGHAYYDDWKESVTDYALYQAAYLNKIRKENQYLRYLDKNYAEAKDYDKKLEAIIERENLKELFLD